MTSLMKGRVGKALAPRARIARVIVAAACAGLFTTACDVHGISDPGTLSAIVISPNPQTLAVNATQQFTAVGTDFSGAKVAISPVWTIATGGGTIGTSGMFTAGTATGTFTATVTATSGGRTATATVIVTPGPLATIVVTPNPATLAIGAAQQYVAVGKDAGGNVVPFTPTWSVVANGGTISAAGLFTAGSVAGTFANTVQASSLGIKGTATVTVTPGALATIAVTPNPIALNVGLAQQFTAVGKDANGNVVALTPVWSVAAGGGAIATSGVFTAGTVPGTYTNTVVATSGGISGSATVVVTAGALATITVSPNPVSLQVGAAQQFTAVGTDAAGNIIPITPVWAAVASGGSIDLSSGVFTAGNTPGTYTNTVRASVGTVAGFATVSVTPGGVSSLTVTPNPATVQTAGTVTFSATAKDAGGNVVPSTPVWAVVNGGGTINANSGAFVAGTTAGTFANTIKATANGISSFATVVVTPVLTTIVVAPNPVIVLANGTQQFAATGRDASGNTFSITPVWAVVNGGGTIDPNTGLFTAGNTPGTFTGTVRATSGSTAGFATVTVTNVVPTLATITVTPNPASLAINTTQQFNAVGRDGNGNIFVITPVWSVVNAAAGTINPATGLFTAGGAAGSYPATVKATVGLISGTADVTETAVAVAPLIDLGQAALNGIMAATAVTCAGPLGTINANVSISPGGALSGFPPCVITGAQHLADATAANDQIALTSAYNQLAAQPCGTTITADLGGTTVLPGVYCAGTTIGVTGTLTLNGNGNSNANFVFKAGTGLTTAGNVVLINGAQAKNVYWLVGSSATLGTGSQFQGNIITLTSITMVDNATLIGRALARQGAVTLGTGNVITLP
ncbi:MAG: hypothetical protein JWM41_448 [Gemmatimonadetes bacterium]|nr:hypothetical protein [Gemmatimonadota bacterium]